MNSTIATTASDGLPSNIHTTLGAAFFGFSVGAILFGITVRQAYQYYTNCSNDPISRKLIIGVVCLLDALHLSFSMYLVYSLVIQLLGYSATAGPNVLWSLKALGSVQVLLIILVQAFYLSQIWRLSSNILIAKKFAVAVQAFVITVALFAAAVAVVFISQLQKIEVIHSFAAGFEYIVYLGFGATALVDCSIAAAMCLILHKSSAGTIKSETVLESLIQYFIGSGLLTSFSSILCIILYVAQPDTLLYLGIEFSVTRLYANSLLAISNGRGRLREKLEQTMELQLPSNVFFGEPDQISLMRSMKDPFSPGESETKFSGSDCDCNMHGHKFDKSLSRQSSGRGYTV